MAIGMDVQVTQSIKLDETVIPTEIHAALTEGTAYIEGQVKRRTPQGLGGAAAGLRGSIAGEVRQSGNFWEGIVGSPLPYAIVIEEGRRPGKRMPPIAALQPWVARFVSIEAGETLESVTFQIARSIGRRGFAGSHMFRKGIEASRSPVIAMFERAGLRITTRLFEQT